MYRKMKTSSENMVLCGQNDLHFNYLLVSVIRTSYGMHFWEGS